MKERPTLITARLLLRPFELDDANEVKRLAGDRDVASTTLNIPHPYENGMAEQWITTHEDKFDQGTEIVFAIIHRQQKYIIGAIGLSNIKKDRATAEIGYWIGKPYWNHGYCTEAADAVLKYGFQEMALNRIYAHHFRRNPASGRVMQKIGMKHEGCLRQHIKKWDRYEDLEIYGILRSEYAISAKMLI